MLTSIKGEINSNTEIVGDFNTPLTPMDRSARKKLNTETQTLNVTLNQMNFIDVYKTFHMKRAEYTFQLHMEHSPG